jgi:hypothetical protein
MVFYSYSINQSNNLPGHFPGGFFVLKKISKKCVRLADFSNKSLQSYRNKNYIYMVGMKKIYFIWFIPTYI